MSVSFPDEQGVRLGVPKSQAKILRWILRSDPWACDCIFGLVEAFGIGALPNVCEPAGGRTRRAEAHMGRKEEVRGRDRPSLYSCRD